MTRYFWLLLVLLLASPAWAQIRLGSNEVPSLDYANPRKYEIGGITVSGSQFLDPNALISITGLKVGDQITVPGEEIGRAINKLWDQGILGDVEVSITKIEGNYIFLDFYLRERPRLSKFAFNGIKKSQADELREKIRLIRGKVVTDAVINNTRNTVRKYFLDKGFLNVKVNIVQQNDSLLPNSVILNINIDKGNRVKIEEIAFEGNEDVSDKKLARQMKNTKEKRPFRIFTTSKFLQAAYEEDKKKIISYYNSEGYRDAAIVSDTVYKSSADRISIRMSIDEGQKYYFRNVTWSGNYLYDSKFLAGVLGIKKGDVYSKEVLDKRLNYNPTGLDITSLYMNDGYLFFNIDPVEVLVEGDSIDIEMRIYEGAQARIKNVTIAGNDKTSDHVVLRELRTIPGQKFSREDLIRSQREIATLGYFDQEKIGINPVPNQADGTVDINYTVEEKPNDQITLSGGWGGPYGFVGTVGLIFNNFSLRKVSKLSEWKPLPAGDGQRVQLNVQANGLRYQSYSMSFTEPWLGGRRANAFTVGLNRTVQRDIFGTEAGPGKLSINGASVSLGRRLRWPDDWFTLSHSVSYYRYKTVEAYNIFPSFPNGASNNISFVNTLSRNSIDNPMYPRSGSSLSLSINLTPPYSLFKPQRNNFEWPEFHKWMVDGSWFIKLAGNLVLNTRAHFGFIGKYNPDISFGPFERFKLGGSGLGGGSFLIGTDYIGLRGYDDDAIQPRNESGVGANQGGGIAYDKFVMELRYPISLNPNATVYVLGFAEGGNNFGSYNDYNPFDLYKSVGIGARIFMPAFGLIGFDYGYGLDQIPGDLRLGSRKYTPGQFHFMIGQQLR